MKLSKFIKLKLEALFNGETSLDGQKKFMSPFIAKFFALTPFVEYSRWATMRGWMSWSLLLFGYMVGPLYHFFAIRREDLSPQDITRTFSIFLVCFPLLLKAYWLFTKKGEIKKILNVAENEMALILEGSREDQIVKRNMKKTRLASLTYCGTIFIFFLLNFIESLISTGSLLPDLPITIPGLYPKSKSPNYEMTLVLVLFIGSFSCTVMMVNNVLFITLITHPKGQAQWLGECMNLEDASEIHAIQHYLKVNRPGTFRYQKNPSRMTDQEKADTILYYIVCKHNHIIRYMDMLRNVYRRTLGAQFVAVMPCLAIILLQARHSSILLTATMLLNALGDIIFYCHFGETLLMTMHSFVFQGLQLLPPSSRRAPAMVVMLLDRTLTLDAWGFFKLSHESMLNIIQKGYAFYSVIYSIIK